MITWGQPPSAVRASNARQFLAASHLPIRDFFLFKLLSKLILTHLRSFAPLDSRGRLSPRELRPPVFSHPKFPI